MNACVLIAAKTEPASSCEFLNFDIKTFLVYDLVCLSSLSVSRWELVWQLI